MSDIALERAARRFQSQDESSRHNIGASWASVGMIVGIVRVHGGCSRLLK